MDKFVDLPSLFSGYYRPQRSSGKVIFSQACVILFRGGGSGPGGSPIFRGVSNFLGSPIFRGSPIFWGVSNFRGGGDGVSNFPRGGGVSNFGGSPNFFFFFFSIFSPKISSGMHQPPPPRDGQCAGGTHPNGMHSCLNYCPLCASSCVNILYWLDASTRDDHLLRSSRLCWVSNWVRGWETQKTRTEILITCKVFIV